MKKEILRDLVIFSAGCTSLYLFRNHALLQIILLILSLFFGISAAIRLFMIIYESGFRLKDITISTFISDGVIPLLVVVFFGWSSLKLVYHWITQLTLNVSTLILYSQAGFFIIFLSILFAERKIIEIPIYKFIIYYFLFGYTFFGSYLLFLPVKINSALPRSSEPECSIYQLQTKYIKKGKAGGHIFIFDINDSSEIVYVNDKALWFSKQTGDPVQLCFQKGFFGFDFLTSIKE